MKYTTKSRQFLEQVCRVREIDGQFYQDKPRAGLKPVYKWTQATHHKYGKTMVYEYVQLYNYETRKGVLMSFHSFLYAWYKGEVPAGYDVDHIDNDTLNNDLDNLQLLTHEENIKKRGGGKNHYTVTKDNPELNQLARQRMSKSMKYLYASGNRKPNSGWGKEAKIRSLDRQIAKLEEEIELMRYISNCNHSEEFYKKKERDLRAKIEILQKKKNSLK